MNCQPNFEIEIVIPKNSNSIKIGDEIQFGLQVKGNSMNEVAIEWNSSDSSIASINNEGIILAKKKGVSIITARVKDTEFTSSKTITVYSPNDVKIYITSKKNQFKVNETFTLDAYIENLPNGIEQNFIWIVENNEIIERVNKKDFSISTFIAKRPGRTSIKVKSTVDYTLAAVFEIEVQAEIGVNKISVDQLSMDSAIVNFLTLLQKNVTYQVFLSESDNLKTIQNIKKNGTKIGEIIDQNQIPISGLKKNKPLYIALVAIIGAYELLLYNYSFVCGAALFYDFTIKNNAGVVLDRTVYGHHADVHKGEFIYSKENKFTYNNGNAFLEFPEITNVNTFFVVAAFSNKIGRIPLLAHTNIIENHFMSSADNFMINPVNNHNNYKNATIYTNGTLCQDNSKIQFSEKQTLYSVSQKIIYTSLKANSTRVANNQKDNWRGAFKKLIIFTNYITDPETIDINSWLNTTK